MSPKISSKTYHFLSKVKNFPHLNYEFFYIFYAFLINLPEMKGKSPSCLFETSHMYDAVVNLIINIGKIQNFYSSCGMMHL